ncbi:hypothetical protein SSS_07335 [Sarcoptes scabiei]|uniref:Uncharacterized protein n=1 Tax=Sarcoptes scabiei TaxID=52283 RepID=A0A834R557_SARSC|nr:hypothetical protein SSS_07335 [Sarcoptes scabiei]
MQDTITRGENIEMIDVDQNDLEDNRQQNDLGDERFDLCSDKRKVESIQSYPSSSMKPSKASKSRINKEKNEILSKKSKLDSKNSDRLKRSTSAKKKSSSKSFVGKKLSKNSSSNHLKISNGLRTNKRAKKISTQKNKATKTSKRLVNLNLEKKPTKKSDHRNNTRINHTDINHRKKKLKTLTSVNDCRLTKNSGYIKCSVCNQTKYYSHVQRRYGIFSCEPCFKFFARFIKQPKHFQCYDQDRCVIALDDDEGSNEIEQSDQSIRYGSSQGSGTRCKACWLKLCFERFKINSEIRESLINEYIPALAYEKSEKQNDEAKNSKSEKLNKNKSSRKISSKSSTSKSNQSDNKFRSEKRKRKKRSILKRNESSLKSFLNTKTNSFETQSIDEENNCAMNNSINIGTSNEDVDNNDNNLDNQINIEPNLLIESSLIDIEDSKEKSPNDAIIQTSFIDDDLDRLIDDALESTEKIKVDDDDDDVDDDEECFNQNRNEIDSESQFNQLFDDRKRIKQRNKSSSLSNSSMKKSRCKVCQGCKAKDCGQCSYCLDKKKFGGSNVIKQACKYRVCVRFNEKSRSKTFQFDCVNCDDTIRSHSSNSCGSSPILRKDSSSFHSSSSSSPLSQQQSQNLHQQQQQTSLPFCCNMEQGSSPNSTNSSNGSCQTFTMYNRCKYDPPLLINDHQMKPICNKFPDVDLYNDYNFTQNQINDGFSSKTLDDYTINYQYPYSNEYRSSIEYPNFRHSNSRNPSNNLCQWDPNSSLDHYHNHLKDCSCFHPNDDQNFLNGIDECKNQINSNDYNRSVMNYYEKDSHTIGNSNHSTILRPESHQYPSSYRFHQSTNQSDASSDLYCQYQNCFGNSFDSSDPQQQQQFQQKESYWMERPTYYGYRNNTTIFDNSNYYQQQETYYSDQRDDFKYRNLNFSE